MKKILVISHNLIGSNNNMGITLDKLFSEVDDQRIGQIYFRNESTKRCHKSLFMTDIDALYNILKREDRWSTNYRDIYKPKELNQVESKKTIYHLVLRDLVWSLTKWNTETLNKFLSDDDYAYIFLAPGYSKFIYDIASYISEKLEIPIVTYLADDYYNGLDFRKSILSTIYQKKLNKNIENILRKSQDIIYISDTMKKKYENELGVGGEVLYTPLIERRSVDRPMNSFKDNQTITITYIGNLSLGRLSVICNFLEVLKKNNLLDSVIVSVYGRLSLEHKQRYNRRFGPVFKGFVEREYLEEVIEKTDVFLHVESFEKNYMRRVCNSFSTKLVDYLGTGKRILLIGPSNVESINYFIRNRIGYVISSEEEQEILETLKYMINDSKAYQRCDYRDVLERNHSVDTFTEYINILLGENHDHIFDD